MPTHFSLHKCQVLLSSKKPTRSNRPRTLHHQSTNGTTGVSNKPTNTKPTPHAPTAYFPRHVVLTLTHSSCTRPQSPHPPGSSKIRPRLPRRGSWHSGIDPRTHRPSRWSPRPSPRSRARSPRQPCRRRSRHPRRSLLMLLRTLLPRWRAAAGGQGGVREREAGRGTLRPGGVALCFLWPPLL